MSPLEEFLVEQAAIVKRTKLYETTMQTAKAHIAEVVQQRADLERRLVKSTEALKERMARETQALQKVQEVLQVAENAIAEKIAAQQREQDVKDECDHLATTIGQVMQEATHKCEQDIEQRQARYAETIKTLENHIGQLNNSMQLQQDKVKQSESRADVFEKQANALLQTNARLDKELESASRTIIEMEIRIQELDQLLAHARQANSLNDERCAELTAFLGEHRRLKQSWKATVKDINDKYVASGQTIDKLRTENHQLRVRLSRQPLDFQYGDEHNLIVVTQTGDIL